MRLYIPYFYPFLLIPLVFNTFLTTVARELRVTVDRLPITKLTWMPLKPANSPSFPLQNAAGYDAMVIQVSQVLKCRWKLEQEQTGSILLHGLCLR